MTKKVGLWIDHRKAVIVSLADEEEETNIIESKIERRPHPAGGSSTPGIPYGPQDAVAEDRLERKYELHLSRYYDEVISSLEDADSIFLFGPGQAKFELRNQIERQARNCNIVGFETTDKMTAAQIKSKVRNFFRVEERA